MGKMRLQFLPSVKLRHSFSQDSVKMKAESKKNNIESVYELMLNNYNWSLVGHSKTVGAHNESC